MCDTMVSTPETSRDGIMIFAKNSDREPNEAQLPEIVPEASHRPGSRLKCTYIEIPQAEKTNRLLLSRPFWMWGAEMGTNEHGLTIGNEAVFTTEKYRKEPSLTGMDLLRLALERASNATEAIDTITGLTDTYGQGGNCGFRHKLYYHNSFIICDPKEAWVLETAGKKWAAKQIHGVYAISNGLTIKNGWDRASDELLREAEREKNAAKEFDFSKAYSDIVYTRLSDCRRRRDRAMELLAAKPVTIRRMMEILRDHDNHPIRRKITGASICNHAGFGPVRGSQTTASMVSSLTPDLQTHFVTAGSAPCTGIFKPLWLDCVIPTLGTPDCCYDENTFFWRHERLHRAVIEHGNSYSTERDILETELTEDALDCIDRKQRNTFCAEAWSRAESEEGNWLDRTLKSRDIESSLLYRNAWKKFNKEAEFHL